MLVVWRLLTARFAATAFSGEGARLYGGRWNPKGVPLVYTAATRSLALLEMLVQDDPPRARYVAIPATIPDGVRIESVELHSLPDDWRDPAGREGLRKIGAAWAASLSSVVLQVPSVVIPAESNFLLNPLHGDFAKIQIGEPEELVTDLRLLTARGAEPAVKRARPAPPRAAAAGPNPSSSISRAPPVADDLYASVREPSSTG